MSPKVVESRLIISGEDRATPKLKDIEQGLIKIAERLASLKDIELPDFGGLGTRGASKRGSAAGAPRSPHAPEPEGRRGGGGGGPRERGGGGEGRGSWFGWRGYGGLSYALGAAGAAPRMAGQMISATTQEMGLQAVAQQMQSAGGGIMGAAGGLGAAVGLPLLAGGVGLGLMHMLAAPGKEWLTGTFPLAARMRGGRTALSKYVGMGVGAGMMPNETAQVLQQLEATGAQQAFGSISRMKMAGVTPDMLTPVINAMTRAGAAPGRTASEYESLTKILQESMRDVRSIPEYLEKLVTMTSMVEAHTADLTDQGVRTIAGVARWMEAGPTAALKGARGAQVFGQIMNWAATPGGPGKEMFMWATMAGSPKARTAAGIAPGAKMSYLDFLIARGKPEAWEAVTGAAAGLPGELGPLLMATQMGVPGDTAKKLIGWYRESQAGGKGPTYFMDKVAEAQKKGELPSKQKDIGGDIASIAASSAWIKNTMMSTDFIKSVVATENKLMQTLGKLTDSKFIDKVSAGVESMAGNLLNLARGDTNLGKFIVDGFETTLGLFFPRNPNGKSYWDRLTDPVQDSGNPNQANEQWVRGMTDPEFAMHMEVTIRRFMSQRNIHMRDMYNWRN